MNTFRAVIRGYSDRLFDYQVLAVHAGFWSGYYSGSKHPKPLHQLVRQMYDRKHNPHQHADDVDVEAFLQMEQRRLEAMQAEVGDPS